MNGDSWAQTLTGHKFDYDNLEGNKISIQDIAGSLSKTCRFNGHCVEFYSVAEHSVFVSRIVRPENALWGLLHDAAEAYIPDLVPALKYKFPQIAQFEQQILAVIAPKFGLVTPIPSDVHTADIIMVAIERKHLMVGGLIWGVDKLCKDMQKAVAAVASVISPRCYDCKAAEKMFLERFNELK